MITLYCLGPMFGLPDPSPFVVKTMLLLKIAKLPFELKPMNFNKAPKGKTPYIETDLGFLGDSHFIKLYIESRQKLDLSGGYSAQDAAKGWAIARMLEEHLYFLMAHARWMPDDNFDKGPARYFDSVPFPIRGFVRTMVRRQVRKTLLAQGLGRHTDAERLQLAKGDVDCVETVLGNNTYLLGQTISEYDATVFAFLFSSASSFFDTALGDHIRSRPYVLAYLERIRAAYFPDCRL